MQRVKFACLALLFICGIAFAKEVPKYAITEEKRNELSAQDALKKLQAGNKRYVLGETRNQNFRQQSQYAARHGQFPFAFVLNCMDARSVPTAVFNQGVGSLFTASVAGNVIDTNMLASMEYAVYVGVPLLVVMGHTQCGAVMAACSNMGFGKITQLLAEIQPAVKEIKGKLNCGSEETIDKIARLNVLNMLKMIKQRSPYLAEKIALHQVLLIGAMHNVKTGKVEFFSF